jgi:tripartite-type tricarboxylate transporter receptor subunit TctC
MQRRTLLTILAIPALPRPISAQPAYPDRPIRLIVPFPPGGGTDVISREISARLQADLGWNIVIENRPGAGGNIGLDAVAKAAPDGFTLGMGQTSNLAINPALYPAMPFDPLRDFALISTVAQQPLVLVTARAAPWGDLAALVAAARAPRARITAGHSGNGTVGHLLGELFAQAAQAEITQVPYRGAGPVTADLLARRVDIFFANPPAVRGLIEAGELRPLAVSGARRSPSFPQAPSLAEAGFPGLIAQNWTGLVAPARTPPAIIARWSEATREALAHAQMTQKLAQEASEPRPSTPEEFRDFLTEEHARWGRIVREVRIEMG